MHTSIEIVQIYTRISSEQYINITHERETHQKNNNNKQTAQMMNERTSEAKKKRVRERQEKINIENENWKHLWIL